MHVTYICMNSYSHIRTHTHIYVYVYICIYIIRANQNCIKSTYRNPTSKFICKSRNPNEVMAWYPGLNRFFTPQNLKMHAEESRTCAFSEEPSGARDLDRIAFTKFKMDWKSIRKTLQRMMSVKCDGCRLYLACVCACACVNMSTKLLFQIIKSIIIMCIQEVWA